MTSQQLDVCTKFEIIVAEDHAHFSSLSVDMHSLVFCCVHTCGMASDARARLPTPH